jgi:bacillithiol biosynthesis cysteine-adding enzyme BshC
MQEVLSVKSECLSFQQIPHSTRLFLDYLSYAPGVRAFYPRSVNFSEWAKEEAQQVRYDEQRRAKISAVLERQNRSFGASEKTLANIERLKRGALAAVTGQQAGLFGGPLFSIFKALSAVRLAETATATGIDCVPIFWIATEDHDLAEVNHISLLTDAGSLQRFETTSHGVEDAPVGTVRFGPEIDAVVARAAALLGDSDAATWLREAYRPGETLGSGFAKLFARMFAEWGVIVLDPADPDLHAIAAPILKAAIERSAELDEVLLARGKVLESAGYHQQVKVTSATTLLFEVQDGARRVVKRRNGGQFVVGGKTVDVKQLVSEIDAHPEKFNPNVLLRPVLQDWLLPTLVYTGGAAEVAYFAQVGVVYERLLGRVTPVLPRFSATLVGPKQKRILDKYGLKLPDLFHGEEKLREAIAARTLPTDVRARIEEAKSAIEKSVSTLREAFERLDPTLKGAATRAGNKMSYQMSKLEARAARAELGKNEIIARHADGLSAALYPHRLLQEREIGGVSILARYGNGLLRELHDAVQTDCHDHQVIEI